MGEHAHTVDPTGLPGDGRSVDPDAEEAVQRQLHLARAQGDAYGHAFDHLRAVTASGAEQRSGDYWIGYALEAAEGTYESEAGERCWREPGAKNLHIAIIVRDAGDGRFLPGARVLVTLTGPDGTEVGTYPHQLLWHPTIHHFGRNWKVATDGQHVLRVCVESPKVMRSDQLNLDRVFDPVEVEFTNVRIDLGNTRG